MLLACLKCQPHGGIAEPVLRYPDKATWYLPLVLVTAREKGGMGSSVAKRDAEPLAIAKCNVRTKLSRRLQDCQRHQVGSNAESRFSFVCDVCQVLKIKDARLRCQDTGPELQ